MDIAVNERNAMECIFCGLGCENALIKEDSRTAKVIGEEALIFLSENFTPLFPR